MDKATIHFIFAKKNKIGKTDIIVNICLIIDLRCEVINPLIY